MPRRRKPFIDKKNATTFRLIPGSVQNPEEDTEEDIDKRKEEQRKYGIFYDDNYDYIQHLRSMTETATMVKVTDFNNTDDEVRSSYGGSMFGGSAYGGSAFGGSVNFRIFSSEVKPKEEHIDTDILASLDEAPEVKITKDGEIEINDDDDIFLEDDFIARAGGYEPKAEVDECDGSNQLFDIDEQDLGSDFEDYDIDEVNDFDDEDMDAVHGEPVVHQSRGRGNVQDDIIEAQTALILKNFEEGLGFSCVAHPMEDVDDEMATTEDYENLKEILLRDKLKESNIVSGNALLNDHENRPKFDYSKFEYDNNEEEEYVWKDVAPSKPKFDCVSILSLNSNTRNLPTDIIPPSFQKHSKPPSTSSTDPSTLPGLSRRELEEEIRLSRKADKASTFRPQDETAEERKSRKKAIKGERKERRQEKKANKTVFSMEKQKLDREVAVLSKSGKGIRLM